VSGKRDEFGNDKKPGWLSFRFSVWDIMFLTSFIAILFALPKIALVPFVFASAFALMMLGVTLMNDILMGPSRKWRGMSASSESVTRGVIYCTITFVVGIISLITRNSF
jgi:hypothetical protein